MLDVVLPGHEDIEDFDRYICDDEEEEPRATAPTVYAIERICRYCGSPLGLYRVSPEDVHRYATWNIEPEDLTDDEVRICGFDPRHTAFHTEYGCCSSCRSREW